MIESDSLIASISLWNPKPQNRVLYREPFVTIWVLSAALWYQFSFNQELGVFLFVFTVLCQGRGDKLINPTIVPLLKSNIVLLVKILVKKNHNQFLLNGARYFMSIACTVYVKVRYFENSL